MPTILHLVKSLTDRPGLPGVYGVRLRPFAGPTDIDVWLDLQSRSFATELVGVRRWTRANFEAEFLVKPWWSPDRLWFAEAAGDDGASELAQPAGCVALAQRGELPVIHWLCVLPQFRRRGIGRLLVAAAERRAWDAGQRRLGLETHAQWESAVRLYRSRGFR